MIRHFHSGPWFFSAGTAPSQFDAKGQPGPDGRSMRGGAVDAVVDEILGDPAARSVLMERVVHYWHEEASRAAARASAN